MDFVVRQKQIDGSVSRKIPTRVCMSLRFDFGSFLFIFKNFHWECDSLSVAVLMSWMLVCLFVFCDFLFNVIFIFLTGNNETKSYFFGTKVCESRI
jgi:hypothetical protein